MVMIEVSDTHYIPVETVENLWTSDKYVNKLCITIYKVFPPYRSGNP